MQQPKPSTLTAAAAVLALTSVVSFASLALPQGDEGIPTVVLYLTVTLGILGLIAAYGLWLSRRWGLVLGIFVIALNVLSAVPGMFFAPTTVLQVANGVGLVISIVNLVLLLRPSTRTSLAR